MIKNPTLEELELEEQTLKYKLSVIQTRISKKLSVFPQIRIESWDASCLYESGIYAIDAPPERVEKMRGVTSSSMTNMVTLKSGEKIGMDEYFTKEEIASIRKV